MYLFAFIAGIFFKKNVFFAFFVIFILIFNRSQPWRLVVVFISGWLWFSFHLQQYSPPSDYLALQQQVHNYQGKILSFRQHFRKMDKYLVEIEKVDGKASVFKLFLILPHHGRSFYPGEVYHWQSKLFLPSVYHNPGSESIWNQLSDRHIWGNCVVFSSVQRLRGLDQGDVLGRLRLEIYQKAYHYLHDPHARALFLTLVLGIGSELEAEDWDLFKATGTAHLMVISGAHLGFAMTLVEKLIALLARIVPKALIFFPQQCLSIVGGLLFGLCYSILCGFGLPLQRAWLMNLFSNLHYFIPYRFEPWQTMRWALFMVVVIEPHALWYPACYLSFAAVAILRFIAKLRLPYQTIMSQFACQLGMGPLTLLWFKNLPILGVLANLIAIPWVSYLLLPAAFIVLMDMYCGPQQFFLQGFGYLTQGLGWLLTKLAMISPINLGTSLSTSLALKLMLMLIYLFWLPSFRRVLMILLAFIWLWIPHDPVLKSGEFWTDVLDVGQGLAVMVRTQHHGLIYDTAGRRGQQTVAELTISPYFRAEHIVQMDRIVVSHPDLDHKAGLNLIRALYPQALVLVDNPSVYQNAQSCFHTPDWCWDGVCFHFLRYQVKARRNKNNHSCVLQIRNKAYQLLLTGDIEKQAETMLLRVLPKSSLQSFLLVPHHGSLTSSSLAMLRQLKPKLAMVSVALHNAYHHPHPKVLARYQLLHIPVLSTAQLGMIRLILNNHTWSYLTWR